MLADLPFAAQKGWLDERLAAGDDPGALLAAAAPLPDHGPLGHLLGRLVARGELEGASLGAALAGLVATGAETAVQVALRALPPGGCPEALVERVARAIEALPLGRVAVAALALRWLREADPGRHRWLRAEAVARCERALDLGMEPPDNVLLLAPGAALAALPGGHRRAASEARERMAPRLLAAIGAAPRSLAQVNAEELLARRVYEGGGHFLFELLQNADDAGASEVALTIEPGELRLRHDGAPFDPLDVLGVLSIGLSTKGAGSIGLFGVGFRSVYAVTERPQIHSGPFRFEISGMARPRPLAPRPDVGDGETLLVLPLDRPGVTAADLAAEADALPAEVLLTLRHLRRLALARPDGPGRDLSLALDRETASPGERTVGETVTPGEPAAGEARPGEPAGETATLHDRVSGSSIQYR
ncbi:MAG: ATP-binding protein, partial [Myxococcales bacterium]